VTVCRPTGDLYFERELAFGTDVFNAVDEVYALRRSGAIERVTRNVELQLGGGARATNLDGFRFSQQCDVIQFTRTHVNGDSAGLEIYWADGTLAHSPPGEQVGANGDSDIAMGAFANNAWTVWMVHKPTGTCKVPADVLPAPAK
jgi:hypothetical protein